ncbi:transferrin [Athalia rosae]|uniref:transferrin n=1 Tax=Athalia rosae TaxID=37344 RepID=UPI002033A424|nr:transferrin [Athalia rosae]
MIPRQAILVALVALFAVGCNSTTTRPSVFTMCVPERFWQECVHMTNESSVKGFPIACIAGRDRYDCIEKVGRKEADIVAVDPEDMYLAAKNNLAATAGYNLVEQVRSKEEPELPYRYEAVAVIHKDLDITSVQGLRGLRSCHTGVGRNVGYKIPITKLTAMGVLSNINNPEYSARENELRALSNLFSKGCLVGEWSPDPAINQRLKETYSNMCALCEKPDVCDYPDNYSGYEGALRCLAHNGGQVAWTKVIYVKRFFGLPVGSAPAVPSTEKPEDFRYFCPDGTKVAIDATTKPCTWAARPWQGYLINGGITGGSVKAVQDEITSLGTLGEENKAPWWKDILLLDEKTLAVKTDPISPLDHLNNAKYTDVIERNSGAPERTARWCVTSNEALEKCNAFARAAFSRDARPRFDCLHEKDADVCLKAIRDGGADVVAIEGGQVEKAVRDFNLKPIVAEKYSEGATKLSEQAAVAVVKKTSTIQNLADLKTKKSCHSGFKGDFAGWSAPAHALKAANLITNPTELSEFFSAGCAPGAPQESKLCTQCVGDKASSDDKVIQATKCKRIDAESYNGDLGALRCLIDDNGDVAFLSITALHKLDKLSKPDKEVKGTDFELLCPTGGRAPIEEWQRCNFGLEPPRVIVSSATKTPNALEELTHGILDAASTYASSPDLLQLFGSWGGHPNLIFKDDTVDLVSVDNTWDAWSRWATTEQEYSIA